MAIVLLAITACVRVLQVCQLVRAFAESSGDNVLARDFIHEWSATLLGTWRCVWVAPRGLEPYVRRLRRGRWCGPMQKLARYVHTCPAP